MSPTVPFCPCQPLKLRSSRAEVTVRHDVVALEHRSRFVSAESHCNAFRNSAAHHVPHSRPSKVVRDSTWATCRDARRSPRLGQRSNRTRFLRTATLRRNHRKKTHGTMWPARFKRAHSACCDSSRVRRSSVIGNTRPSSVLRRLRIRPNFTRLEIHLTPFECQYFGRNAPASDVGEFNDGRRGSGRWARRARSISSSKNPFLVFRSSSNGTWGR
jgi:hypothetical protein